MLGVSFDTEAENKAFAEKFNFPFALLCDTSRDIGVKYGACKSATDRNASRIGYVIDPLGKVLRAYAKVDAKSFPETVLSEF